MRTSGRVIPGVLAVLLCVTASTDATVLTFNIYSDAAKTTHATNNHLLPGSYGDNVGTFEPTGQFGGLYYYSYGTGGGLTPNVAVEYRWWTTPGDNGTSNGRVWNTGYGNLSYAAYPTVGASFLEIRLIPTGGYTVMLDGFDVAAFGATLNNQTLKVVRDAGSITGDTLWRAGPDGTVSVTGGASHDSYLFPNRQLFVASGHTLSLILPMSGNAGVDNIAFSQILPEPGSLLLITGALAWSLRPGRRPGRRARASHDA